MKKLQNGRVENLSQMPNGSKIVFAKELATLLNPYKIAICSLNVPLMFALSFYPQNFL